MKTGTLKITHKLPKKLIEPLLVAFGFFYIVFHVLSGEHGVYALLKEERRLEILKAELNQVSGERKELEHRVHLMSSGSLDPDMLDEQARKILDDAQENEVVIPLNKNR